MTEEVREKAIFYFQDRLSKFCSADKNRPNEYEITMYSAGYQVAMDEANKRIQKLREALERIEYGNGLMRDASDHEKIAYAALKEDDLKST